MPVINVKMTHEDGGATKEQKEELSKGITELFAKVFNGRGANSAIVIIEEVNTDNYSIGGKTITQIRSENKWDSFSFMDKSWFFYIQKVKCIQLIQLYNH